MLAPCPTEFWSLCVLEPIFFRKIAWIADGVKPQAHVLKSKMRFINILLSTQHLIHKMKSSKLQSSLYTSTLITLGN
jgi:hypothetical protein